ncbi:MAG: flagellin [Alphaproteobacteria bacterium]
MSSDVVLTSALRSNLLSLQNTQSLIDTTQLRLATGLKVNSALDGPSNFFAAQSLDNRASDLGRLLDGVGQSIRTIEAADNGVTALTSLVEQAQSITSSARDELASSTGEARLVGNVDLSDTADLTALAGIADGDQIVISTVNDAGTRVSETITISTGDSGDSLTAKITNAFADNQGGEISASLTDEGFLSIESTDGRSFRITTDETNEIDLAGFNDLGIGSAFTVETRGTAAADGAELVATTVIAGNTATSISLFESAGNVAEAGDLLTGTYLNANENTVVSNLAAGDVININVNDGGTTRNASFTVAATSTFQDLVDAVNQDTDTQDLIQANFDSDSGTLSITSTADSVNSVEIALTDTLTATDAQFDLSFGDTSGLLDAPGAIGAVDGDNIDTTVTFNTSTESLDALASDYNSLREQIDTLVRDAQYRGVNLLGGDDLTTFFNEDNTSSLVTSGQTFTANGLGLNEATFRTAASIETTSTQSREALNSVRSFGSTLANNLSIIQTRQSFTEQTINTLEAGADDLTVADQNEEGANLLALQTRQTLGVTSLSLASQSQQAVLRLF